MENYLDIIRQILPPERIIQDEVLRYAYATDASLYRMLPKLVLLVKNAYEVGELLALANRQQLQLTFRAAGTSLSGQAVTDQILVVLATDSWQDFTISAYGQQITLAPGIIGAEANRLLANYRRQIGPDPGSINAAKIGGILANNSSGMCCGTSKNSYATLVGLRAILANGIQLDTTSPAAIELFRIEQADFVAQIMHLREQIVSDSELSTFIRSKFAIKNTSGYSLNAFLDFSDPLQIIARLLIGSEGTLGFISQVTLNTVANPEFKALNLLYAELPAIIDLTVRIADFGVSSIELLDALSLRSVAHISELAPYLIAVDEDSAAIMIELSAASEAELQAKLAQVEGEIARTKLIQQTGFTQDAELAATLWQARKGVLPTIAGARPLGTTVLIEDVAVRLELLPALIHELRQMFMRYDYQNAAIFGHVLAGNIHFVLTPNFSNPEEVARYDRFMHEFSELVVTRFNGSLKAEHGSGRNIAPFAKLEWGERCWDIMWQIKALFDPQNILNPDVKLTRDNSLHLHNLKQFTAVDPLIDKCMECGFCEPVCPSRALSMTPRGRNAVARKIAELSGSEQAAWRASYQQHAVESCAMTGMCQVSCPVGINTGEYMRQHKPLQPKQLNHAQLINTQRLKVKSANFGAAIIGRENLHRLTAAAHKQLAKIPVYLPTMPAAQVRKFAVTPAVQSEAKLPRVTLLPSCPNRVFAASSMKGNPSQQLLEKMGFGVDYLSQSAELCCGQIYHSQANPVMQEQMLIQLRQIESSATPLILDNSSCAGFAREQEIAVEEISQFIVANLAHAKLRRNYRKIAVHFDCSSSKYGFARGVLEILKLCADEVVVPTGIKCCGFAGEKGFTHPDLNASSLAPLADQVAGCEVGVTFNRNCQIGLSLHGKVEYLSFSELILNCWQE